MKHASTSLLKKLADFKQESFAIAKDQQAYGYKYAPLDTILPVIEPLLKKHDLGYYHKTGVAKNGQTFLQTFIYEITPKGVEGLSGGYISSKILIDDTVVLAKMNKFMVIGSALTYFRRYHLVTMLGLLTDEDTDTATGTGGRSIDRAIPEQDYTKMFANLIQAGKTEKQIRAFYTQYSKNFTEKQAKDLTILIEKTYENK